MTVTCVIGAVDERGSVWMGADSALSDWQVVRQSARPKVFRVGEFLIGVTTSVRMWQILEFHLGVPAQAEGEDADHYLVCTFVEAVRAALKERGFARIENNQEEGGTFLVGYRGRLYTVEGDFQASRYVEGFDAVGCGRSFALGAMAALSGEAMETRIRRALDIAARFSPGVTGPFHVEMLPAPVSENTKPEDEG